MTLQDTVYDTKNATTVNQFLSYKVVIAEMEKQVSLIMILSSDFALTETFPDAV